MSSQLIIELTNQLESNFTLGEEKIKQSTKNAHFQQLTCHKSSLIGAEGKCWVPSDPISEECGIDANEKLYFFLVFSFSIHSFFSILKLYFIFFHLLFFRIDWHVIIIGGVIVENNISTGKDCEVKKTTEKSNIMTR